MLAGGVLLGNEFANKCNVIPGFITDVLLIFSLGLKHFSGVDSFAFLVQCVISVFWEVNNSKQMEGSMTY